MSLENSLLIMVITSAFGMGYFVYGKKQAKVVPLLSGILLCFYPYFVTNLLPSLLLGGVLIVLPWVLKI
jgi:hypothetical protein